jgi:cell division protein FtsI (penicillin-binding protein 3)
MECGAHRGPPDPQDRALLGVMPDETRDIDISDIAPLIANGEGE